MDPGTKLGILVGGAGVLVAAIWLVARRVLGPAPAKRDSNASEDGGMPPGGHD